MTGPSTLLVRRFSTILLFVIATHYAAAQTYSVLYSFKGGTDGASPSGRLVADHKGNLYGTAAQGGISSSNLPNGAGVVFKIDPSGNETVLYSFSGGADGGTPINGVTIDEAGYLYGTTWYGGVASGTNGAGVLYKISPSGKETVLYTFPRTGGYPAYPTNVVEDATGILWTTTGAGGYGYGTVFDFSLQDLIGAYEHQFLNSPDGNGGGGVALDSHGNLFGVCPAGGNAGAGLVFEVNLSNQFYQVIYSFGGGQYGFGPTSPPMLDHKGDVFGTTVLGGMSSYQWTNGAGIAFEIDNLGIEHTLYTFQGGTDGALPNSGLVSGKHHMLYGVTQYGGNLNVNGGVGQGDVYSLDKLGHQTVLYAFSGGADGGSPIGLMSGKHHILYGVTGTGGNTTSQFPGGAGVVYKLTP